MMLYMYILLSNNNVLEYFLPIQIYHLLELALMLMMAMLMGCIIISVMHIIIITAHEYNISIKQVLLPVENLWVCEGLPSRVRTKSRNPA